MVWVSSTREHTMRRYVIERAIPEIGSADREALKGAAAQSNGVLSAMQAEGKGIQWEHSYVASDKTVCIYVAENADLIAEHAERSGFPATTVTEIGKIIDPTTAND
jgi:hypothetical protein